MDCSAETLVNIGGIGPTVAESLVDFFAQSQNRKTIAALLERGVKITYAGRREKGPLSGRTFVLTGALSGLTRRQAGELIAAAGGKVGSAVSAGTDFLVAGEKAGAKLDKARSLGVTVIGEQEFRTMLEDGESGLSQ